MNGAKRSASHGSQVSNNGHALVVSTYVKGAVQGRGLGTAGYSYEFVRQLFLPLLQRWGEVVLVGNLPKQIEAAAAKLRKRHLTPIHLGFVAVQDMYVSPQMRNIVVPAWEFPDIPNFGFDGNEQNDWIATSNKCSMVLAHVPFTAQALVKAGVTTPVVEVPVPMPSPYLEAGVVRPQDQVTLQAAGYVFDGYAGDTPTPLLPPVSVSRRLKRLPRKAARLGLRTAKKGLLQITPGVLWSTLSTLRQQWRLARAVRQTVAYPQTNPLNLSGIVYTSIFNPGDGRKNYLDLLTGFIEALKDYEDATLVLKLVTNDPHRLFDIVQNYRRIATPHRCRIVIIREYLSENQMMGLLRASSYYITTTRAEGNCLPLMNYLAAGRPGISPAHSAIGDYFDNNVGFVVQSHPEPAAFPHELTHRLRTSWARLVWPSLVEAIQKSYRLAKHERRGYESMSAEARERMRAWLNEENVYRLLGSALDAAAGVAASATPARRAA